MHTPVVRSYIVHTLHIYNILSGIYSYLARALSHAIKANLNVCIIVKRRRESDRAIVYEILHTRQMVVKLSACYYARLDEKFHYYKRRLQHVLKNELPLTVCVCATSEFTILSSGVLVVSREFIESGLSRQ